ncbi:MAG: shikimate kinase [bacterium]
MRGVVLVGFMGTGKTVVGKKLAERLQMKFIDVDGLIEERSGTSISEIFDRFGEPHFRKVEKEVVAEVSAGDGLVVATGGGAVLDPENVTNLKSMGKMIHLSARPDVILERTKDADDRPLLETADRRKQIAALLAKRAPFYARADYEIDTSELSVEDVVDEIVSYLKESFDGRSVG